MSARNEARRTSRAENLPAGMKGDMIATVFMMLIQQEITLWGDILAATLVDNFASATEFVNAQCRHIASEINDFREPRQLDFSSSESSIKIQRSRTAGLTATGYSNAAGLCH